MLIRFGEFYQNTEVLSPIDKETWRAIGETCRLGPGSKLLELASGKGAFAMYVPGMFGCHLDATLPSSEFIQYAANRAEELGLASNVSFTNRDVNNLEVTSSAYDAGVCLGALYLFRDA